MKQIIILGATGDLGTQCLDILKYNTEYDVVAVALKSHYEKLEDYLFYFPGLQTFIIEDEEAKEAFIKKHPAFKDFTGSGRTAIKYLYDCFPNATVFNAISGVDGLLPTLWAMEKNMDILLANKESYVLGGSLIQEKMKKYTGTIYPVDSEHVALRKCFRSSTCKHIGNVVITASGGALRDKKRWELANVKPEEVLAHPTWKMSKKITVDSATLVNKGYEVIEASYMFHLPVDYIKVDICRDSTIHAGVMFIRGRKGYWNYEYAPCDMKLAILSSLSKDKIGLHDLSNDNAPLFDKEVAELKPLDKKQYPLFDLTLKFFQQYGNAGMFYYNALDCKLIDAFLKGEISYLEIEDGLFYLYKNMIPTRKLMESNIEYFIQDGENLASRLLNKKPWRSTCK